MYYVFLLSFICLTSSHYDDFFLKSQSARGLKRCPMYLFVATRVKLVHLSRCSAASVFISDIRMNFLSFHFCVLIEVDRKCPSPVPVCGPTRSLCSRCRWTGCRWRWSTHHLLSSLTVFCVQLLMTCPSVSMSHVPVHVVTLVFTGPC